MPNQAKNRLISSGEAALSSALEPGPRLMELWLENWVDGGVGRGLVTFPIMTTGKQEASDLLGEGEGGLAFDSIIMAQANGNSQATTMLAGFLGEGEVDSIVGPAACALRLFLSHGRNCQSPPSRWPASSG